ncbi:hypothetical protein S100390_v1c03660 [Spiroplasma sp. NBRC 100390]|uniref:hypothetical protein n=1 Tax=unclassified Spiroplasma TaxID=2637901 RepID=UPI0008929E59|nr:MULTISPECIES: hypothetical protein [unclassified Spiroplasma]AOX43709.1 hypothetical protein STU14_v1c03660 [Spiroplasma sp. TU-14]APE13179.1 hypothetical protein S100390_v1c03660 [Spiroplasma sp. NBRC 100390]
MKKVGLEETVPSNLLNTKKIFYAPGQGKNVLKKDYINRIKIDEGNAKQYVVILINAVLAVLRRNDVIEQIQNYNTSKNLFTINSRFEDDQTSYFIVPMSIYGQEFSLVFRVSDFYVQGIINLQHGQQTYNYFQDASIRSLDSQEKINENRLITIVRGSNYNFLMKEEKRDIHFNWSTNILPSFNNIANVNIYDNTAISSQDFGRAIVATAETLRFREVRGMIEGSDAATNLTWNDFYPIVTSWATWTKNAIEWISKYGDLKNWDLTNQILILSYVVWSRDDSGIYSVFKWTKYAHTWDDFVYKYPFFAINGFLKAEIVGESGRVVSNPVVLTQNIGFPGGAQMACNFFITGTKYTAITLTLWCDDDSIKWQWKAYFKGRNTNGIELKLDYIKFYAKL